MLCTSELYFFTFLEGKSWCCDVVHKNPDLIPHSQWGKWMTDAEKSTWDHSNCNYLVGGSKKDQCSGTGLEI